MEERLRELLNKTDVSKFAEEWIENFNFEDTDELEDLALCIWCDVNCPVRNTCDKITNILKIDIACQDILRLYLHGIIEFDKRE